MLMMAVALTCSLTFGLWVLSVQRQRLAFTAIFFLQQITLNVILSTQAGLVPDLIPAAQHDVAGGASAANILLGAVSACAYVQYAKTLDFHMTYAVIASLMTAFCILVCSTAQEKPCLEAQQSCLDAQPGWTEAIAQRYSFDTTEYPDFFLLLVTKTLYCASVVVKAFLLFFVQDLFRALPNSRYEAMVSEMAAVAEVVAALSALGLLMWLGSGSALDAEETSMALKKQRSLFCLIGGALWMALLWLGPVVLGAGANSQRQEMPSEKLAETWLPRMLVGLGLWGIGQGVYLASDQASMFALLPDKEQASRLLGLSSVCSFLGSMFGGGIAAFLLSFFGASPGDSGYAFQGYAAIFIFASLLSMAMAVTASRIQIGKETSCLV